MQSSFSDMEYAAKKKLTRRNRFLAGIHAATSWAALEAEIEPFYPKGESWRGTPIGLSRMLHMYVAQQCFGLFDEGMEDGLYDGQAIRGFVGIDLSRESALDATTPLKFRRLLETHGVTRKIFEAINAHLAEQGLILCEGTIVDVTLIMAPPSTKNMAKARDPEMPQAKKGKSWHFGMKAHIGVDAQSGLVHALVTTAANTSDLSQTHILLHGQGLTTFGDAGYQGVEKRPENRGKTVEWLLAKKEARLVSLFGFANLVLANRRMSAIHGRGAS